MRFVVTLSLDVVPTYPVRLTETKAETRKKLEQSVHDYFFEKRSNGGFTWRNGRIKMIRHSVRLAKH